MLLKDPSPFLFFEIFEKIAKDWKVVASQSPCQDWLWDFLDCSTPSSSLLHYFLEFAQTHAHLDTAPRAIFSRGGPARISGQHGSVGWFVTRHLTISTVTGGSKARAGHAPSRSSIRCYVSPQTLILLFRICWGKKGVIELAIPVL